MYRGHTTAVVVPAYNEEPFVADTVRSVPEFVDRVYVVDDGSTDGTWQEILAAADEANDAHRPDRELVETDAHRTDDEPAWTDDGGVDDRRTDEFAERVVPIQHDRNRGVGGAIKTGYLRAREDGVQVTAVMGADGQMEPEMLGDLLDPIVEGRADYTKGNRFIGRTDRGDMPAHRFVGNATLAALTKVASGYWETGDPQSGYTAISLRALETVDVESMYEFYGYCNDLLVKLNVAGMRVVDVPRPITYGDEESHIRYRTYVPRVSAMLARNFGWRLKTNYLAFDFHPLVGAYAAGALASVAGVLGFVWSLPGVGRFATPLARGALALVVFVVGVVSLVLAAALDMRANDHLNDVEPRSDDTSRESTAVTGTDAEAVTVELGPRELAVLLDDERKNGDAVSGESAARQLRERLRERLPETDTAAD